MSEEKINNISTLLNHHFEDDRAFAESVNKRLDKHEKLMEISGEHQSHIRKDMTDIKNLIINQDKMRSKDRYDFDAYRKRTEDMILAYEESVIVKKSDNERGEILVKWSIRVGAISVLGSSLLWIISKLKLF